jgi:hypothetical protein
VGAVGKIAPPITADGPESVPGEDTLIQAMNGALEDATPNTRGLRPAPATADVPGLSGAMMVRSRGLAPPARPSCAPFEHAPCAFRRLLSRMTTHIPAFMGVLTAYTCTLPEEAGAFARLQHLQRHGTRCSVRSPR